MAERCLTWSCHVDSLVGILHEPESLVGDVGVLVIVGGPQYRIGSHRSFVLLARRLAAAGYPVLRFDYRGMGDSTGAHRTFEAVENDIRTAVDLFAAECPRIRCVVLFGLCDAASAALMYCRADERVKGLVLANPWVRTDAGEARTRVRHYYWARVFQRGFWAKLWAGEVRLVRSLGELVKSLRRMRGGVASGRDSHNEGFLQRMKHGLAGFGGPILLLMSERDLTAREFDGLCETNDDWADLLDGDMISRINLGGADHTFSSAESLNAASRELVGWLGGRRWADTVSPTRR